MKTATPTFRQVRPDHYEVDRDGTRLGSISQAPAYKLNGAGEWRFWPVGEASRGPFQTLDQAKQTIQ